MALPKPPGRLGDPDMTLGTDPRTNSKLLEALKALNLDGRSHAATGLTRDSPLDAIRQYALDSGDRLEGLQKSMDYTVPGDKSTSTAITRSEEHIVGPDGNQIKLIICRPSDATTSRAPMSAVVYFHGGGMVVLTTENPMHMSWVEAMARTGLVAIAVDFRNALTRTGSNPFPAGLNDCVAAVRWVDSHRDQLGIGKIILQGNSGGANLALATALKANKSGWIGAIDGVWVSVPYISGAYHLSRDWKLRNLPSLVECDEYFEKCQTSALSSKMYDPSDENARNPLAWPYWATEEDMEGLPPHSIVTSELDPFRDEGNSYYMNLVKAGVRVVGRMNMGITHEGEMSFRRVLPDQFLTSLWDVKAFSDRL